MAQLQHKIPICVHLVVNPTTGGNPMKRDGLTTTQGPNDHVFKAKGAQGLGPGSLGLGPWAQAPALTS